MHRFLIFPVLTLVAALSPAVAADPVPAPILAPAGEPVAIQALPESAEVSLKDSRGSRVAIRVPLALHRPANRFRLYGMRPLTLWDAGRRRDLYRDAFLEMATQSGLKAPVTTWDTLSRQLDWLTGPRGGGVPGATVLPRDPGKEIGELARRLAVQPNYGNLQALGKAVGDSAANAGTEAVLGQAREPVVTALQLRALATDQAEQRLLRLGAILVDGEPRGIDPAMREGYTLARQEFAEVRQGLWPAVGSQVKKSGGKLLFSAAKNLVLSRLGWWALFGELGWQGAEASLNAEYHGQYSVVIATAMHRLSDARIARRPEDASLPLYCEYALTYRLTEALKSGQMFGLSPAGGRAPGDWQILWSTRLGELKAALSAG